MKSISNFIAAASMAVALVAFAAPAAQAGEFCAADSSVKGCNYETLEQCKAAVSGAGGWCKRDPFYKGPANAQAYQQKPPRSRAKQTVN